MSQEDEILENKTSIWEDSLNEPLIPKKIVLPNVEVVTEVPATNSSPTTENEYLVLTQKQHPGTDTETEKVRSVLKEKGLAFGVGNPAIVYLQCTEYVSYRLLQDGIVIDWSKRNGRERNGKDWPEVLKDTYEVNQTPTKGAAVSYPATQGNPVGHIAYVEEVSEEGGFYLISEANYDNHGSYRNGNKKTKENVTVGFIHFELPKRA
jgi:surface antigen